MKSTMILMMTVVVMTAGCSMGSQDDGASLLIHSEVSCPTCSVVIENVATLEDAYFRAPETVIARDSEGRVLFEDASDGLVKVYGDDGRFIRHIGRHGGGPGEYEVVRNILVDHDGSIRILDAALGRLSTFSPDGQFLGSTQVPITGGLGMPAVLLRDGYLVVNAAERARAGVNVNHVMKVIDPSGKAVRSFDEIPSNSRKWWLAERLLCHRANGDVLVARPFTFTIDVFAADLTRKRSVARVADWIPLAAPESEPSDGVYDTPATPRLASIWEDDQELLWLFMVVPSPAWRPGPSIEQVQSRSADAHSELAKRPRSQIVIEVIDLERRRVLTRYRRDAYIGTRFGRGYFAFSAQDSANEPSLRISRAYLKR
jgi:hypothetical protein